MTKIVNISVTLLLIVNVVAAQELRFPPENLQFKKHNINNMHMTVTNYASCMPVFNSGEEVGILFNYPAGSAQELTEEEGFWLGAVVDGDTLVSTGCNYDGVTGRGYQYEFFPRFDENDTIYSASLFDPISDSARENVFFNSDGKLSKNYKPKSEQDYITQYWDDKILFGVNQAPVILEDHVPLHAHVIQRTFAWSFFLYDKILFYEYFIVNEGKKVWNDVYFAYYTDAQMGSDKNLSRLADDYNQYDRSRHALIHGDMPGGNDGTTINNAIVGSRFVKAPKSLNAADLKYTFRHWVGNEDPVNNKNAYAYMSSGEIMPDMQIGIPPGRSVRGLLSIGPFNAVQPGDTLHFIYAYCVGDGRDDLLTNLDAAKKLYEADFNVPISPSPPKFTAKSLNKSIELNWKWEPGYKGINPEEFEDKSRKDGVLKDFEGYRIYRSTQGPDGPWEIVAEFDKVDGYGFDTGLQYTYVDKGLVNGIRYWYAITSFDLPEKVSDILTIESLESPKILSTRETIPSFSKEELGNDEVFVVPNPYRGDVDYTSAPGWEYPTQPGRNVWYEIDRRIAFMNLPSECTIKIFTIAGYEVERIDFQQGGGPPIAFWNLLNKNNHAVASGLYYFVVTQPNGDKQIGKFVIVK